MNRVRTLKARIHRAPVSVAFLVGGVILCLIGILSLRKGDQLGAGLRAICFGVSAVAVGLWRLRAASEPEHQGEQGHPRAMFILNIVILVSFLFFALGALAWGFLEGGGAIVLGMVIAVAPAIAFGIGLRNSISYFRSGPRQNV